MNDKVVKLTAHEGGGNAFLNQIERFITENELMDIDETIENDVLLDAPSSDETRLGPLTPFERRCFVLGTLLEQLIIDFSQDHAATLNERVAQVMRKERLDQYHAVMKVNQERFTEDERLYLNQCSLAMSVLLGQYTWSLRHRYGDFLNPVIVRNGFVAYSHR